MAVATKERKYVLKKPTPTNVRSRSASAPRARREADALPGWKDLTGANRRRAGSARGQSFLASFSTSRFALLIVGLAVLFTMYVGHVHATQDLLAELEHTRRENLRMHLKYNRLKGEFDRMVGPEVIYARAHPLGLIEDPAFGPTIEIER